MEVHPKYSIRIDTQETSYNVNIYHRVQQTTLQSTHVSHVIRGSQNLRPTQALGMVKSTDDGVVALKFRNSNFTIPVACFLTSCLGMLALSCNTANSKLTPPAYVRQWQPSRALRIEERTSRCLKLVLWWAGNIILYRVWLRTFLRGGLHSALGWQPIIF